MGPFGQACPRPGTTLTTLDSSALWRAPAVVARDLVSLVTPTACVGKHRPALLASTCTQPKQWLLLVGELTTVSRERDFKLIGGRAGASLGCAWPAADGARRPSTALGRPTVRMPQADIRYRSSIGWRG